MPARPEHTNRSRWASVIALGLMFVVGPVARADAARPTTAPLRAISASSAVRGTGAALAADARTSTAWRPLAGHPWRWHARVRGRHAVVSVDLLFAAHRQRVTVMTSTDGRTFAPLRTVVARPGQWRVVRLARPRPLRAITIRSASRARRVRLAEVRVRVESSELLPDAPAGLSAGSAAAPLSPSAPTSTVPVSPSAPTSPPPVPVPRSGSFAGVLDAPIDPAYLTSMPFGTRSHWLQPWRAYLDTVPARQLRDAVGINFNVNADEAAAAARLLAANGFHEARLEISWGEVDYRNPARLWRQGVWETKLQALRDAGLRPLILLNSNDARPAPSEQLQLTITSTVSAGARTVQLDPASAAAVVPGRTGFDGGRAAAILITSVSRSGQASLSMPMPVRVPAGTYPASLLRYEPFRPLTAPDGSSDARGEETIAGWLSYVDTVTGFVRDVLGSTSFDVEVTNEVTFGAAFYNINQYYSPALTAQPLDPHVLLERTLERIKDRRRGLAGVRVVSGVSNQSPWDSGANSPVGLDALGKHVYPRYLRFPETRIANPAVEDTPGGGQTFTPAYTTFFPEYYLSGIQTETLVRDIAPITTMIQDPSGRAVPHGRNVPTPDGIPPEVWMTEMGLETGWAATGLGQSLSRTDVEHIRAKSTLRTLVSFVNKGVTQVDLYAAGTAEWGLIGDEFWEALRSGSRYPGDDSGGATVTGVGRLVHALGTSPITAHRSLTLASVADYDGHVQWTGDGGAHPPLFDRDVLALLPFQASDHRFVAPVYVMTRNLVTVYDDSTGPERFDLPAERYQLTIGGIDATRARVQATDPLTGRAVPVTVVDRTRSGWLVVEMPVTDSPRLLTIDDARAVSGVSLSQSVRLPHVLVVGHPNVVTHNQLVYVRLAELGWKVSIIVPNRWLDEYSPSGFTPRPITGFVGRFSRVRVARPGNVQRHFYVASPARWLSGALRPDVLFLEHEPFSVPALQWGTACARRGIPWGTQGDENLDRPLPWPAQAIRALTIPRASFFAARSPGGARMLRQWGATAPVDIVPHTLPEWPLPPRTRNSTFTIGFAGRLVEAKGIRDLVAAAARLPFPFRLLVVGDGPLRDGLKRAFLGRGTVDLRTGVRSDAMPSLYAQMDLLALPSRTTETWAEQFGKVLGEALLCGTPVVGSSSGEIPWIIDTTGGGRVVPEGDVAALASALGELHDDPALRRSLAEAGRLGVQRHLSPGVAAAALAQLLAGALELPLRRRGRRVRAARFGEGS
jgi:glycosyltransferase involved in cell wall biosynthesis